MPVSVGSSTIAINNLVGYGTATYPSGGNSLVASTGTESKWDSLSNVAPVGSNIAGRYGPWWPIQTIYCRNSNLARFNSEVFSYYSVASSFLAYYVEITDVYYNSATSYTNPYLKCSLNSPTGPTTVDWRLYEINSTFNVTATSFPSLFQIENSLNYSNRSFGNLYLPNFNNTSSTKKIITLSGLGFYNGDVKRSYGVGSVSGSYSSLTSVNFTSDSGNFYGKFTLYGMM